jgi:hypothetical protein
VRRDLSGYSANQLHDMHAEARKKVERARMALEDAQRRHGHALEEVARLHEALTAVEGNPS